jgi:hypothetical protein
VGIQDRSVQTKGFHSKENQIALKENLQPVVLPRKGKLSQAQQEEEQASEFVKARRAHSAVESAINALEVHGLDVCPDHGIDRFKRYVALAVLAKNIHRIGAILWQKTLNVSTKRRTLLIGTTNIDSRRSKSQQIHFLGSGNPDSGKKLECKPAKIALRPRRFEIHHKFPVKQHEKPHALNL